MNKNVQALQQHGENIVAAGGQYVGSLISLSVQGVNAIPAQTIIDRIVANPDIPNDWAPETLNHLSLYFECMRELKRSSLDKFDIDEAGADAHLSFNDFGGFIVETLYKRSAEDMPAAHKVLYKRRVAKDVLDGNGNVTDRRFEDLEVDEGITLFLERTSGDAESDKTGHSTFRIMADKPVADYYAVFVRTLSRIFWQKRQDFYDSAQVSALILDMIRNKMHANPLNRGLYFLHRDQHAALNAIEQEFSSLHEGIQFIHVPIAKFDGNTPANKAFESVSKSVETSMVESAKALRQEIDELVNSDSKTRAGTWADRLSRVVELRKRAKSYRQDALLRSDAVDSIIEKMIDTIKANMA